MKTISSLILGALCFFSLSAIAARDYSGQVTVISAGAQKIGNDLQLECVIDYSHLEVAANDQLLLQPVIVSEEDTLRLPYLLFPGRIRNKVNLREIRLYGVDGSRFPDPYATLFPTAEARDIFTYRQNIPFEKWMYGARIELWQDIYGCADCHQVVAHLPLNQVAGLPLVAFIVPAPDTLREERITLFIGFPWDQAVIREDFGDNAAELEKINRSMLRIANVPGGFIHQIELTGYASPEGRFPYNTRLAERRVQAMKNYLSKLYPVSETSFVLHTVPEDWEGVRKWTQNSGLPMASQVVAIIDRIPDPDARDGYIRRLDGNATYRRLLREAYPPLRRVEYRVGYRTDPLSPEQSQEVYHSHPERLTPYELYRLAGNYGQETSAFREIILATVNYYPKNTVALNNAACIALQEEDLEAARVYLGQSQESPQKLNNQGVLLLLEGKYSEAYRCFMEAGKCGCKEAIANRHNLERTQYNLNKAVNDLPN